MTGKNLPSQPRYLAFLEAALVLHRAGEDEDALTLLHRALAIEPAHAPTHVLHGLIHQTKGSAAEAESAFRRALALEPANAEALQSLGLLLASIGRFSEALPYLEQHLKSISNDQTTLGALVTALQKLERPAEAVAVLRRAWEQGHESEIGIRGVRLLLSRGQAEEAREWATQIAQATPSARTLTELSLVLVVLEDLEAAVPALQQAVALDANFDRAWRGLSHCFTRLGRNEQALEAAERALAINPKHYRNWQAKGDALLALERHAEVLETSRMAIDLIAPDDQEARPVLGVLYSQRVQALLALGELDQALETLATARRALPEDGEFYGLAMQLLLLRDQPEGALAVADEARGAGMAESSPLTPYRFEALHQLGRAQEAWDFVRPQLERKAEARLDRLADRAINLYRRGHTGPARAVFQQLAEFAPDQARFAMGLAFIEIGDGDLADAERRLQAARSLPSAQDLQAVIACDLGFLFLVQGRWPEAEAELQQGLTLAEPDETSIQRVAFWAGGQIVLDYARHPDRSLSLRAVALANLVALALARGDQVEAEARARELADLELDDSLTHTVLGVVRRAAGKPQEAAAAWRRALELAEGPDEAQMLESWLADLQPPET